MKNESVREGLCQPFLLIPSPNTRPAIASATRASEIPSGAVGVGSGVDPVVGGTVVGEGITGVVTSVGAAVVGVASTGI